MIVNEGLFDGDFSLDDLGDAIVTLAAGTAVPDVDEPGRTRILEADTQISVPLINVNRGTLRGRLDIWGELDNRGGLIEGVGDPGVSFPSTTILNTGGRIQGTSEFGIASLIGGELGGNPRLQFVEEGTRFTDVHLLPGSNPILGLELFLTGSMRNDGLISDEDDGGILSINGAVDLGGSGEIRMSTEIGGSPIPNFPAADSYQLTNGPDHTITSVLTDATVGGLIVHDLGVVNRGTMRTDTADLLLDPGQGASRPNAFLNQGLLQADGHTVEIQNGIFGNDGTVEATNGGSVVFAPEATNASRLGSTLLGGSWIADASSTPGSSLSLGGGPIGVNLADVRLRGATASFPEILGIDDNRGALRLDDFALARPALTSSGVAGLSGTARLELAGGYTQTAGALQLDGGTLAAASTDVAGGTIAGNGTVAGNSRAAGFIDPGPDEGGLLIFDGDLVLTPQASLMIDLTELAGLQLDRVEVFGELTLEDGFDVLLGWNGPGAGPPPGSVLDILTARCRPARRRGASAADCTTSRPSR